MEDRPYPYPVALHWTQEPESLKKLKNKLLLYFQKRSESNGGECEIRDTDCSRGYVLIYFKEEKARDGVLQKEVHELKLPGGKKMRLDVRSAGADGGGRSEGSPEDSRANLTPRPPDVSAPSDKTQHVTQDPSSSLLLIENLQDSYTDDMFNLLVENISEKNEDTDFHVERIPEKQSAVITFTCDIDIMRFVETFSRNSRMRALKMTAKLLEESRSIRVEGVPPNTPEDYITLYFENPKHGSLGSVEDTLAIPDEGAALVTFTTIEATKKVLGRKHQFSKKDVSVYPYYPSQDIVLYGKQRPHIQKPEPLTFPISPYILEFILRNAQQKDNMEKTMEAHTCEIKWPDLLCPNPEITLNFPDTLSTHLRTLTKLVPTWKDTAHAEFSRLISKYKVIEHKMDQAVWDAIREHVSSSTYNEVLIKADVAAEKVFLAGMSLEVTEIDPTFRKLVEETTEQVERKNQGKTETLSMSPALYQIWCNSGLQKKILDQVPELKIDYDVPRKEIRLSGLGNEVLTAKQEILNMQIQLETTTTQRNPQLSQFPMSTNNEGIFGLFSGSQSGVAEDRSSEVKTTPDNEVTQEPPSSLVLIEKVQDSYTPEMLNLLVENISQKMEGKDFYVERIPEIQSAVVTFTCDIDISRFSKNFSSHHRVQNKLTARPLEESRIVRVENLPENIPEMFLAAFFENPKQGGGRVKEIVMLPEEKAALITFHDTADVKRVLKKEHVFSKTKISVYPYYPMLSIALYGQQGPCIEIPKPIEFNISPYILQHICNNEELKNNIDKEMTDKHCEIKWPDQDCQNPALQLIFPPSLATHLRSVAKIVPNWNEEVWNEFSLLISKFRVKEYKMDQSVWEAIREHVSSSTYDRVLIKPEFDSDKVFLAGMSKDVTEIDPTFRKLVEETTEQVERKKQTKTETLSMSPALYQIWCNSGLKKKILDQVPELKIDYDVPRKEIRLSGLREEVLTAKREILNIKQEMKSKSIQMNPHLLQFLTSTNNEELSCLLFVRHNINALLEIDDDNVGLTAYSKKDLMEAEEQLKQELVCRQVCVEAKSVLKSPEWRSLHSYLLESCNAEKSTVLILELLSGAENNVVIAGLSSNVDKCYQKVSDFLEENTPVEKKIQCKSLVVVEFLKEEKKQVLDELKSDNLTVAICNKNIRLKGPKLYVSKAYTRISDVLRSLFSDTLYIDKPGAKKFCLEHEDLYITMAKNTFRCLLRFQKEEEEETAEDETEEMEGPQCQVILPNGVIISVYKDDLCRLKVDVIVNAANEELKHIGGLAAAILKAAGPKLQDDSDQIVKTEGKLSAGESVATDSGRLPCKQIIHTVGPRWYSTLPTQRDRLLQKAITSSLALAEEYCHSSIAIPAVSSGIFGCPVDKSAENIIKAVKEYMANRPKSSSTLKEIHLVDTNENTVRSFASTLKKEFGEEEAEPAPKYIQKRPERVERSFPKERVYERNVSTNQMMTKENIVITVGEGFIQGVTTDAVVNSVGNDLNLSSGGASKALLEKAGDKLQQQLNNVRSGVQAKDGSVLITEGCNLSCKTVIHVVVPQWDGGNGSSEKIFREVVRSCLCESEKMKMRSITFPAIGTGILGFPKRAVASFMFEEILKFSSKSHPQHLRDVRFILHPSDKETITEFSKQLSSRMDRNAAVRTQSNMAAPGPSHSSQVGAGSSPGFFGTVSTPVAGTHEMKVGSVTYQVKTGDITKEDTDVIVNSTDKTFTMRSGVSKAILEAAGQSVVDECTRLGSQGGSKHIVTQSGNLRCKNILHRAGANSAKGIQAFITESLTECARLRATSVAFPAIGTGMGSVSSSTVADTILESVANFAQSPQSIQMVKVVIFQKQMLNDFHTSMKKKEGNAMPKNEGFISKMKNSILSIIGWNTEGSEGPEVFELSENIEPAIIHLCAERRDAVDKAKSWLRDLIMKEQNENIITDDWIREFNEQEQEAVLQLQKEYQVSLVFDLPNFTVKVLGLSRDVLEVGNKIHDMIKTVRDKKTRDREAELCSNLVEWGYLNGSNFIPFDKMTNMELEKAKNENTQSVDVYISGVKYKVIVELLNARDPRGNTLKIQRNSKHGKLDVPAHWDPMRNENMKVIPLAAGSQEYTDVEAQFRKSCQMRIIKMERIQNRHLWINYQIKKQSIDERNGTNSNEKQLFHGLDPNTVSNVNHNGFNRSYAGKNAACYGNGTYFAVNASYSADNTYSRPDGKGYKYMYLSRVVTGVSCVGHQGMITPPPKNAAKPTDMYDSATNNLTNPAMYVIFHDIQAYPEYLITFTP